MGMGFVQVIEFTTSRIDEAESLMEEWAKKTEGKRSASRGVLTKDRDRPNTYVQIVEFPSYEEASRNSDMPETSEFAEQVAKLCDSPPTFRNLDVRRLDDFT